MPVKYREFIYLYNFEISYVKSSLECKVFWNPLIYDTLDI